MTKTFTCSSTTRSIKYCILIYKKDITWQISSWMLMSCQRYAWSQLGKNHKITIISHQSKHKSLNHTYINKNNVIQTYTSTPTHPSPNLYIPTPQHDTHPSSNPYTHTHQHDTHPSPNPYTSTQHTHLPPTPTHIQPPTENVYTHSEK